MLVFYLLCVFILVFYLLVFYMFVPMELASYDPSALPRDYELPGRSWERQEDSRKLESHDPLALPSDDVLQEAPQSQKVTIQRPCREIIS